MRSHTSIRDLQPGTAPPANGGELSSRRQPRPRHRPRLLPVLVALFLTAALVTGCGTASTTSSSSATTVASAAAAAGGTEATPGTCPTSNTTSFAKTKFVLHAGLAFGAFHRYLYKPFQAGSFSSGTSGRLLSIIKAGAAALFIVHEVRLTAGDVEANPTLCKLIAAPLRDLTSSVSGLASKLTGGDTSSIPAAQNSVTAAASAATSTGNTVTENPNPPIG